MKTKSMKKVYVIEKGMSYEGCEVLFVAGTLAKAFDLLREILIKEKVLKCNHICKLGKNKFMFEIDYGIYYTITSMKVL